MKKLFFCLAIIFVFSLLLSLPLLRPGLHVMHDDQQVARLFLLDEALKAGQFPPRWVNGLGFGFGYPLFNFYPPITYFVGELFHLLGFSFIDSIKLVFFTSIFASGLAMFVFLRRLLGNYPAQIGSIFYMFVPYRAIDVYIRGALAEAFSFVWLPLILWSFYEVYKTNKSKYIYLSALFVGLLMLTHNLIFLPFMLLLPFYLLFLLQKSPRKKLLTINYLLSTTFAFALTAFFWLPALLEKKFTVVDQLLLVNLANYNIHYVYPQQLWNSLWGFGGSAAGIMDGISFKIGKLHIIASILAFTLAAAYWIRSKKEKLPTTHYLLPTTFFLLLLTSAFMTTAYSKPIWDAMPQLGYLQFPWRFLTFTALFSSILAGYFVFLLKVPIVKLITGVILILFLLNFNLKLFQPKEIRTNLTDEVATSNEVINWDVSQSSFDYIPSGVELVKGPLGTNLVNIQKDQIPQQKLQVENGRAAITIVENTPHRVEATINGETDTELRANIYNFPGWKVTVDNQTAVIDDNNKFKLISFIVPQGTHSIKVKFQNTPIRNVANVISLVTLVLLVFLASGSISSRIGIKDGR